METTFNAIATPIFRGSWSENKLSIIVPPNILIGHFAGCKSENYKAQATILQLIFMSRIKAFISDYHLGIIKDFVERYAADTRDFIFEILAENFQICYLEQKDIEIAARETIDNFDVALMLACAKKESLDAVISDSIELLENSFNIPTLKPDEFINRYDRDNNTLKEIGGLKDTAKHAKKMLVEDLEIDEDIPQNIALGEWTLEGFETTIISDVNTKASVKIWNPNYQSKNSEAKGKSISVTEKGNGPVDALVKSLKGALRMANPETPIPELTVDHVNLVSGAQGEDAIIEAQVTLSQGTIACQGTYQHTDTVKAVFYAVVKTISKYMKADGDHGSSVLRHLDLSQIHQELQKEKNLSRIHMNAVELERECLAGLGVTDASIVNCTFKNIVFGDLNSSAPEWHNVKVFSSNFITTAFNNANLSNINVGNSKLDNSNFSRARIGFCDISSSSLNSAEFDDAHLQSCKIVTSKLGETTWKDSKLEHCFLWGVSLKNAVFYRAYLYMTTMYEVNLRNAEFVESKIVCADFARSNLSGAKFMGAKLGTTNFAQAILTDADFRGCNLTKVNLKNAVLKGANLDGAVITPVQRKLLLGAVNLSNVRVYDKSQPCYDYSVNLIKHREDSHKVCESSTT
ncbi:MAG: pentapeptide repeat-containing protein [Cyanobacteria bacterium P01_G01_bin.39]